MAKKEVGQIYKHPNGNRIEIRITCDEENIKPVQDFVLQTTDKMKLHFFGWDKQTNG